ncbi:hypothetical protein G6708_07015 [Polynucleobacter paneuropaeus]|nr:hypothetical protein [Polynucleobacter paneuropaeus]
MHTSKLTTKIVIPIYKKDFNEMELFSIAHSLKILSKYSAVFVHPYSLSLDYFKKNFSKVSFIGFPDSYFSSVAAYNQLCYNPDFYKSFLEIDKILLLQPDAIIIKDELEAWLSKDYDYIGSPECINCNYGLAEIPPFSELKFLAPIILNGLNGGLSLRNPSAFIEAISEYPNLTSIFKNYGGGIGEDIFFSVLGRVSKKFKVPNEIIASKFSLTGDFSGWQRFNSGAVPMGFHRWYVNDADKNFVLDAIKARNT